ncbi:hypothetical protein [Nostoc sp.]|uniref:hypothetical protein n=1 Tax=Nostoc sp. TaxID=1180 RepID=UPI002FF9EF08
MISLIYAVAFKLAFTSSVDAIFASGKPGDFSASNLMKSAATPNHTCATNATHKFEVHVQGKPLAGLTINLPEGVKIDRGIELLVGVTSRREAIALIFILISYLRVKIIIDSIDILQNLVSITPQTKFTPYFGKLVY